MSGTIGKAFKISRNTVKTYGYAKPRGKAGRGMRPNAGVTAIAAINGRGSYKGRTARQAMAGKSASQRMAHARNMTPGQRRAFAERMRAARAGKSGGMRANATKKQVAAARSNIRRAIQARKAWGRAVKPGQHIRVGQKRHAWGTLPAAKKLAAGVYTANRRKSKMRRNRATPAQRLAALRNLRKARAAMKSNRKRRVRSNRKRRRVHANSVKPNRRRRRVHANRKRRVRSNRRRVRRVRSNRRRRVRSNRRRRVRSNRRRRVRSNRRRRVRSNRRRRVRSNRRRRVRSNRRRRVRSNRRRRVRSNRRRRVRSNRRRRYSANKRRHRRNRRRRVHANRRHRSNRRRRHRSNRRRRYSANRRRHRRNAGGFFGKLFRANRSAYRRNGSMVETLKAALKTGALITVGIAAHKALTKLVSDLVLDKLLGAPPTPAAPVPTPPATSGLEALQPYKGLLAAAASATVGIVATNMLVKDVHTKVLITGGMAGSLLHSVLVYALQRFGQAKALDYLSGDAARLSAMYGFGASIMPHYAPIGEYFTDSMAGYGEYFDSGVSGLGNYTGNPDLMQAAAGYGALPASNSNIIDPGSDLDRELSIAEAAAGVGAVAYQAAAGYGKVQPYEASAGYGEYFSDVSGLGAIASLPAANTWIPGMSHPQIWAGTRGIDNRQMATAMVPAGIMNSGGNQGVFGRY